jgi:hypothetical protein
MKNALVKLALIGSFAFLAACDDKKLPAEVKEIYVKADTGLDTNAGTLDKPLKTIKKSLEVWKAGKELVLLPATYSEVSGEQWPYDLPAGVIIKSTAAGVVLESNLATRPNAFNVSSVQIENVAFKDFATALVQSSGKQTLKGVIFESNNAASMTGSAEADWSNLNFRKGSVSLLGQSLTNLKGAIFGTAFRAILVTDSAQLNLENGSTPDGPVVNAIVVARRNAKASVKNSTLSTIIEALEVIGGAKLDVVNTIISSTTGPGVFVSSSSTLSMTGGSISVPNDGIEARSYANVTVDGTKITATSATGKGITMSTGSLKVSNAQISSQNTAVEITEQTDFILRNSSLYTRTNNNWALYINDAGPVNGITDLGTAASPGGNTFKTVSSNLFPLVNIQIGTFATTTVNASGNTWRPSVQGADAAGKYAAATVVGPSALAQQNYYVGTGVTLKF